MGYREDFFRYNKGVNGYYQCTCCKGWYKKSEIDVDHRVSKRNGGTDDVWNLQAMCKHCNRSKGRHNTSAETAETLIAGTVSGLTQGGIEGSINNLARFGKSVATQKIKDALGIKYNR